MFFLTFLHCPFISTASSQQTTGPLDGSIYATILKSPKIPERSSSSTFPFPTTTNTPTPQKPTRTSTSTILISPPPEFSNSKLDLLNSTNPSNHPQPQHHELLRSHSFTPQPHQHHLSNSSRVSYEEIRNPPSANGGFQRSQPPNLRSTYNGRPSSSQSHYHEQQRSLSRSSNYTTTSQPPLRSLVDPFQLDHQQQSLQQRHQTALQQANGNHRAGQVRSPLTLSMDSGISSSGVVNRKCSRNQ